LKTSEVAERAERRWGKPVRESTENVAKRKYEGKFVFKHPPDFKYASISYTATLPNWTRRKAVLLLLLS
jgi:hypothetical protein